MTTPPIPTTLLAALPESLRDLARRAWVTAPQSVVWIAGLRDVTTEERRKLLECLPGRGR